MTGVQRITSQTSRFAPQLAKAATFGILAWLVAAAGTLPASAFDPRVSVTATAQLDPAQSFLTGKSVGMKRCIRAMLGDYTVKKVKIHGHHFNCKPMQAIRNTRRIILDHEQFGADDLIMISFLVDSRNRLVADTLDVFHLPGISSKIPLFKAVKLGKFDYRQVAREARAIKPKNQAHWQKVVEQIAYVTIAEVGIDSDADRVNCNVPVFWEHDNFRGTALNSRTDLTYLQKVRIEGRHLNNRISSLCVPKGYVVTVYELGDFHGNALSIKGPKQFEDLKRQTISGRPLNWGDKITSIRIARKR